MDKSQKIRWGRKIPKKGQPCMAAFLPLFIFVAVAATGFPWACQRKESPKAAASPPEVLVTEAATRDVPVYREWIGTLDGSENADIRARVSGYLLKRNYKEGSFVKKGDLLFEIDPRPFEAALAEAKSQLQQSKHLQLATQSESERSETLFKRQVISEKEYINDIQMNFSNVAKVGAQTAALEQARLNLEFCKIFSPVDGIAGIAQAQVGDLVGTPGGMVLTSVSTLDPLKLLFPISEVEYLIARQRIEESLSQPLNERPAFIQLILADGTPFPYQGRLLSVNRQVNQATGTILVTALLENPGNVLRPGQFARARVLVENLSGAVVVPQRAVMEIQGNYQLGIVGPGGIAEIRPVKVGARDGKDWVIASGLKPGEQVVVEGVQKIKAGSPVVAKPWTVAMGTPKVSAK